MLAGGTYPGIVVSDRWNGYAHLDPTRRQVCWSHLQRDFRRHADGPGEQKTFGEKGVPLTEQVFAASRCSQHEHHDRRRIEPTNNPAERALRGPVIHRKLSLGTQSHHGERFAERALSAATYVFLQSGRAVRPGFAGTRGRVGRLPRVSGVAEQQ